MKTICKLAVLALAGAIAAVFAGSALATRKLSVQQAATALTIKVSQDQTDAQPAKISIYVPATYTVTLGQAPGAKIGTTTGQVFARDVGIPLPLEGDVVVADPKNFVSSPCSPGTNQAVWILDLQVAGQKVQLPVYVNATTGGETALGSAKLVVCLGPADTPMGSPGRSPNGAQLLEATFTVNGIFTPPAGGGRWFAFTTPYSAGTGVPNPAGTVETRSFVGPGAVRLSSKIVNRKKKLLRLSGFVTQLGVPVQGGNVKLFLNGKARFSAKSKGVAGAFSFVLKNTNRVVKTTTFQAVATVPARDVTDTGCASPTQVGIPCVSATAGPFTAKSRKLKIRL